MYSAFYASGSTIGYASQHFPELEQAAQNPQPLLGQLKSQGFCSIPLSNETLTYLRALADQESDWLSSYVNGSDVTEIAFVEKQIEDPLQGAVQAIFQALLQAILSESEGLQAETVEMSRSLLRRHANSAEIKETGRWHRIPSQWEQAKLGRVQANAYHDDASNVLFTGVVAVPEIDGTPSQRTMYIPFTHTQDVYNASVPVVRRGDGDTLSPQCMPTSSLNIWCAWGVQKLASQLPDAHLFWPLIHRAPYSEDEQKLREGFSSRVAAIFTGTTAFVRADA